MQLPPENRLLSYEKQYEVAGWRATTLAMAKAGEFFMPEYGHRDTCGSATLRLCLTAYKDSSMLLRDVRQYTRTAPGNGNVSSDLWQATIFHDHAGGVRAINPLFLAAHSLYYPQNNKHRNIYKAAKLERFEPLVDEFADYYYSDIVDALASPKNGHPIASTVRDIQHKSAFYAGLYDPALTSDN